ncbi:MAG: SEC-C metal-binding domain-containing protein [Promethearchaeota archaeon]
MNLQETIRWLGRRPVNLRQIHNKIVIGRNDSCPCGSGRKYKKCCLPKVNAKLYRESPIAKKEREKEAKYYNKLYKKLTENKDV